VNKNIFINFFLMFNYSSYEKLLKKNIEEQEKKEKEIKINKQRKSIKNILFKLKKRMKN